MTRFRNQRTLFQPVSLSGIGYWSGLQVNVEIRPAPADSGITFVRADLAAQPRIPVHTNHCVEIPRRTSIQYGSASVEMIEHLMAALAGLQIDNCEIWVDRAEMPAFDGSSREVVEAIGKVEIVEQEHTKPTLVIDQEIRIDFEDCWIAAYPTKSPGLQLRYELDYEADVIGQQTLELAVTPHSFVTELASARTFLLQAEADWLRSQGLGQSVGFGDLLVFGPQGVIDNQLRFPDECVRHKALDAVGDLAVAGFDIQGKIIAHKTGHKMNGQFVKMLVDYFGRQNTTRMSA